MVGLWWPSVKWGKMPCLHLRKKLIFGLVVRELRIPPQVTGGLGLMSEVPKIFAWVLTFKSVHFSESDLTDNQSLICQAS